jgi:hypothetical protein
MQRLLAGSLRAKRAEVMELTLLTVPDCPHAVAFEERVAAALAGHPGAAIRRREIADVQKAEKAGMHGSPTLLINGTDPFAAPDQPTSLSCRQYRDEAGRASGAPSAQALRQALAAAMTEPDLPRRFPRPPLGIRLPVAASVTTLTRACTRRRGLRSGS